MKIRETPRRIAAASLGLVVVGALAACSSDDDSADSTGTTGQETVTVTEEPGTSTESATTSESPTTENNAAGGGDGGSVATLVFDGEDLASQYTNVQCREDGSDEFEIDLWNDDRTERVEIDLDVRDEPRVDGLGVDRDNKEWESTDAQEREATVEVDGDTYRVNGQVEVDDDHPDAGDVADLEVEVSCA